MTEKAYCPPCKVYFETPDGTKFLQHPPGYNGCLTPECCHCTVEITEQEFLEEEQDDAINDLYNNYFRQTVGDWKLNYAQLRNNPHHQKGFVEWLKTIMQRVESYTPAGVQRSNDPDAILPTK